MKQFMLLPTKKQQQQTRIVPLEPGLKRWRNRKIIAVILLLIGILQFFLPATVHYGLLSFLSSSPLIFGIMQLVSLSTLEKTERLRDEKRQVAAQRQLKKSPLIYILPVLDASSPYAKMLPASLELRLQRNWYASGIAGLVIAHLMVWSIYGFWLFDVPGLRTINLGWLDIAFDVVLFFTLSFYLVQWLINAPHQSLLATEDGLLYHHGSHTSYIPWHEIRLFAVIAGIDDKKNTLRYEVSSEYEVIRWTAIPFSFTAFSMSTIGHTAFGLARACPSQEEYFQRTQALLHFISKQIQLPLYDLR